MNAPDGRVLLQPPSECQRVVRVSLDAKRERLHCQSTAPVSSIHFHTLKVLTALQKQEGALGRQAAAEVAKDLDTDLDSECGGAKRLREPAGSGVNTEIDPVELCGHT